MTDKASLTVGATSTAALGVDPLDDPHPPTLPSRYLDLVTRHAQADLGWAEQSLPLMRYRAEYGSPLGPSARTLELALETDQAGSVSVTWSITPDLDLAAHFLTLRDLATGATTDMWTSATYALAVAPGQRVLRIEIQPGRVPPPVAFDQTVTLAEDTSLAITLSAADAQNHPLSYRTLTPPAHGTLLGSEPNVSYFPAPNYNGPDAFTFLANNDSADSNVATVEITVTSVNDPPVAMGQSIATDEDTPVAIHLVGTDVDGDALAFSLAGGPSHGTLTGTGADLVYTPAADYDAADAFAFTASDGQLTSAPASVGITVAAVPDPPRVAFSVPGPARDVATLDNNLASYFEGASIASASSQTLGFPASNAIDENALTLWKSANGQPADQFLVVELPDGSSLDRVRLVNGYGTGGQAVKRFQIKVSTTTTDPAAFTTVLSDSAADIAIVQEFALPAATAARYVQLFAIDNWGNACCVAVREFEAVSDALGGIPSYTATPSNVGLASEGASATASSEYSAGFGAALAIDGLPATRWASGNGHPANESLTVSLALGKSYPIDRVRIWNAFGAASQAVKDFRISVSNTTTDPGAFATALTGTLQDVAGVQEFAFPGGPLDARYVRFTALANYGSACCSSIADLEVVPLPSTPASVSSYSGPDFRPERILDGKPSTAWRTASGKVTNQFVEVRLEDEVLVDRLRILGWPSVADLPIKDFDVLVSTTSDDDAAFSAVLSATNLNNGALQEFAFPAGPRRARYVRLLARNNYGNSGMLTVSSLEVVSVASEGNRISTNAAVLGHSSQFGSFGPQAALDADPAPPGWVTASGQTSDQWLKIALPASQAWLVDHVALQPRSESGFEASSPRRFEIQLSRTTSDDAAFVTVLKGTLRNNGTLQHFFFDTVDAKYVRVLLTDNYGGSVSGLQTFAVYSPQIGSLNARFRDRSTDADGAISAYAWTFGDAASSSERDPAHAYATTGHFDVTLAATDDTLLTSSRLQPYDAIGGPQPSFSVGPSAPAEGATVTFTDNSVDAAGLVLREWDFGDGKPRIVSAAPTATHTYDDDGMYAVTLRVTNFWGTASSVSQNLTATNLPPTVDAGPDRKLRLGQDWGALPVVGDSGPADVPSLRCQWDFGDGQTAEIQNCGLVTARLAHAYATQGTYTATLTVTDKNGASSTDGMTVRVYPPECVVGTATFVEFPFCGNGYSVANLGSVPGLSASSYSGLIVDRSDSDQLLLGTNAIEAQAAIYSVGLVRDGGHHISGFSGATALLASVPFVDGGLAYAPNGTLFTAQYPSQTLVQIKPGSHAPDKVTPNGSIGVNSISLNFVPNGFPGECALKFVSFFTAQWWSSSIAPNASETYDVSPAYEAARINNGGPEHLLYVPAGSAIFADRNTVLVTEYSVGNIVAYNLDAKGDPIPSTRALFMSGYPGPEAMAIDPVTGDLLVSNLGGVSVNRIAGLRPPASQIALTPATATREPAQPHTLTATVTEPLGAGRAGLSVAFAVTSGPNAGANGSCAPNPDCTTDANGVVRFSYTGGGAPGTDFVQASFVGAGCGTIASPLARVDWATNRPPVAQPAPVATDEDTPVAVVLVASDPDGDSLSYEITATPQHGVLSGVAPGLSYAPAANYNGADSFTYKVNDGVADSNVATVSITIAPVNDAPVANGQAVTISEDTATAITLIAIDGEGDALTYSIDAPPAQGTLTGTPPNLTYAPAANYNGADSFSFKANDGAADSNIAAVSITVAPVNDAPVANGQAVTTSEDTPVALALVATDVDADPLTYAIVGPPAHGTLTGTPPDLTYTPAVNYNGPDGFSFTASDGQAQSNTATVTFDVLPVNDAPVAADQAITTDEDTPEAVTLLAADLDGDALSYVLGTPPAHGTLTGTAPALSYVPAANENGLDSFTFSVNDGSAVSNVATVSISVTPVNDPPVAPSVALQVAQGLAVSVSIAATDVDGDALAYTIVSPPAHGTLSGTAPDLIYTSTGNYAGPDAFTFEASDGAAESNLGTVSIDVVGQLNHAPVCTGALADQTSLWPPNHKMKSIAVTHVSDEDGDPVAIQATAIWSDEPADAPGSGNKSPDAVLEPIQVRSERSGEGNGRVYVIEFTAADGHGASCIGAVQVCVPHDQGQGDQCIDDGDRYDATKK